MTSMHLSSSHDPKSKTFEALAPVAYLVLDQLSIIAPTKALLISKYYYNKVIPSLQCSIKPQAHLRFGKRHAVFLRSHHKSFKVSSYPAGRKYGKRHFDEVLSVSFPESSGRQYLGVPANESRTNRIHVGGHQLHGTLECAFHLDDDHSLTLEELFDELEMTLDQSPTVAKILFIIHTSHPFQNLTRMIQVLFYRPLFAYEVRILIQLKENVKYTSDSDWEDAFGRPFWKAIVLAIAGNAVTETTEVSVDEDETDAFRRLMFYIPQAERFKQLIEKEGWESLLDDEEEKRLFELYWKDWMVIEEADRNLLDERGYQCRSWSNMEIQT
ncbi:uncharacterized protein IAS62_002328 [Cryptococcus decagattii]|uniref:F-box domain-containing protein n=1 Tax=Cryptococcus decagattii TaxID=1859122 RepID=A0ABZ2AR82_9TREE